MDKDVERRVRDADRRANEYRELADTLATALLMAFILGASYLAMLIFG